MALPKQVQVQLDALEALEKQLAENQKPAPTEPDPQPAEPNPEPAPEPAEPKPVETKPEPTEPAVAEETWQQKYKTLKGMYDAEVPRLHSDIRELKSQMELFRKAAETPKSEVKSAKAEKLVTDADVEAFGSDLIEVQRKVAREVAMEFRGELDAMKAENEELRKQLNATGNQVSEASFEQRLHRMVPDFQEVNVDPKWIAWLNEVDPLLRGPRMTVAQEAFNRGDAEGIAHYVSLFKATLKSADVEPTPNKAEEIARQVQPKRSASSAPAASQQGKLYTDRDIQNMFKRAVELGSRGQPDEARKLEAEIDAAYRDGRVRA
jgi:hypothetical protein